ncbi:MAG: GAF domain-containing protein, partial [Chloroflexi bacterium]|nr:GAF domain-containing protein [Chloroflexota bacterium]
MHEQRILQLLAGQAAIALENAQLYEEERRRAEEAEAMLEVGQAVSSTLELERILQTIVNEMAKVIGVKQSGVVLFDEAREYGYVAAEYQEAPDNTAAKVRIFLCGNPSIDRILATKEPLAIYDAETDPLTIAIRDVVRLRGIKSILIAPLIVKGEVVGTIGLDSTEERRRFTPEEIRLCELMATQAAMAIENAGLYEKAKEHAERLRILHKIGEEITSDLELDRILESIAEHIVHLVGAKRSLFLLVDVEEHRLLKATGYSYSREHLESFTFKEFEEGVSGWVLREERPALVADAQKDPRNTGIALERAKQFNTKSLIVAPLLVRGEVIGTLTAVNTVDDSTFTEEDLNLVVMLADQAAIAIANAQSFKELQAYTRHMDALVKVSKNLAKTFKLDDQLDLVWQFVKEQFDISTFFVALYDRLANKVYFPLAYDKDQPVHISEYSLDDLSQWGTTGHVVKKGQDLHWASEEEGWEVQELLGVQPKLVGEPCVSCLFLPLKAGEDIIGVISIQSYVPHAFSPVVRNVFRALASQVATAIKNAQLYQEAQAGLQTLQSLYEGSSAIISTMDPERILDVIVQKAHRALGGCRAEVIRITEMEEPIELAALGFDKRPDIATWIRPDGISVQVVRSGTSRIIENVEAKSDTVNPWMLQDGVGAAACVPLNLRDKTIGVMWIQFEAPHRFLPAEIEALHLYANQAAIAYDNARRMQELEQMRQAAEAMAGPLDLRQVLQRIADSARKVLQADSSAIWSYDSVRNEFIPKELVACGIPGDELERFRKKEPKKRGTADTVMDQGLVGVTDISDPQYDFMGPSTLEFLYSLGVKSFQGVALKVGNEELGVLYVNYNSPRSFGEEDKRTLETFASHAALVLKKARLLKQLNIAREAAALIAEVTVVEDLGKTLRSIVRETATVLDADTVTLYPYSPETGQFGHPPAMAGVWNEEPIRRLSEARKGTAVWKVLGLDRLHVAEDAPSDEVMRGRFVREERVKSCVGIPLKIKGMTVGVVFINYRSRHRFTNDELTSIRLFANQAAVAIRNAQLYQAEQRHGQALKAIQATSAAVSAVLELDDLLPMITDKAADIFSAPATSLMLWDERQENLVIRAAFGLGDEYRQKQRIARSKVDELIRDRGLGPQIFDIHCEPIGEAELVHGEKLYTVLATPLTIGNELIGILNVYGKDEPRRFEEKEKELATIFANYAAIAIQNARQFRLREGLLKAGEVVTAEGELYPALEVIAQSVKETIDCDVVSLYTCDQERRDISYPSVVVGELHKPQEQADWQLVSQERRLQIDLLGEHSVIRKLLKHGLSRFTFCSTEDPILGAGNFVVREGIESSAGILLKIGEEVVGILFVNYRSAHRFTDEERQAAELFAQQAAVTIRNAQLYEEATRRATALETLYEAGRAVTSTLTLNEILHHIVEQAWRLTEPRGEKTHFSHLALVDGNRIRFVAAHPSEMLARLQDRVPEIDLEEDVPIGITGRVVVTCQSQLVRDVLEDPDYIETDPRVRSQLGVPIQLGEQVVGVINVEHPENDAFDEEDQRALDALASQVAIAIQNARLYQQATERLEESQALQQVATSLAGTLDLEEVLNVLMMEAMKLTDTDSGSILFWDSQTKAFTRTLTTTEPNRTLQPYRSRARREGGIARAIIDELRPIVISDTLEDPRVSPVAIEKERRALVGVPLVSREEPIGVLYVNSSEPRQFSNRQVRLLEALASQAAVAIERASQYEELKRTKGLVGARTALAWMGMASSAWRHSIEGHAINIRNAITLLHREIQAAPVDLTGQQS